MEYTAEQKKTFFKYMNKLWSVIQGFKGAVPMNSTIGKLNDISNLQKIVCPESPQANALFMEWISKTENNAAVFYLENFEVSVKSNIW